jgi:hypothetical protein
MKPLSALKSENARQFTRGFNTLRVATLPTDAETVSTPFGVLTVKTSPAAGQVAIGAAPTNTVQNLVAALNTAAAGTAAASAISANELLIELIGDGTPGIMGNAAATAVLTSTANYVAGDNFSLNGELYTFVALLNDANVNEIVVGATEALSIQNAVDCVNGNPEQLGNTISLHQKPNNSFVGVVTSVHVATFTATVPGTPGNSLTTTEACASATFGGATAAGGTDLPQFSDTLTETNDAWASPTWIGASRVQTEDYVRTQDLTSRVPNAQEIALKSMHFLFGFTPRAYIVAVVDSTGKAKAYDGTVTIVGKRLTLTNAAGAVNLAANDLVTVLASE